MKGGAQMADSSVAQGQRGRAGAGCSLSLVLLGLLAVALFTRVALASRPGGDLGGSPARTVPGTADAFLELRPGPGAPPNGGTSQVGDRFVLELWMNAGTNP